MVKKSIGILSVIIILLIITSCKTDITAQSSKCVSDDTKQISSGLVSAISSDSSSQSGPNTEDAQEIMYNKAIKALNENRKLIAYGILSRLGDYKDAEKTCEDIRNAALSSPVNCTGSYYITKAGKLAFKPYGIKNDVILESFTDMIALNSAPGCGIFVGLKSDGTLALCEGSIHDDNTEMIEKLSKWTDIVQITASEDVYFGLKPNGTVTMEMSESSKTYYSDVSDWKNIIQIACNGSILAGLRSDGTVVMPKKATEKLENYYKCSLDVSGWKNIVMISVTGSGVYGIKKDGSVIAVGKWGYSDISIPTGWTDIVYISAENQFTVNSDGTVIDEKGNYYSCPDAAYYGESSDGFYYVRNDGSVWTKNSDDTNLLYNKTDVKIP